jgi:nitrogen-specific signal transduction histidine kinase
MGLMLSGCHQVPGARRGGGVEIESADERGGMNDEGLGPIFVPFGSTKQGGTGVGMLVEEVHERGARP